MRELYQFSYNYLLLEHLTHEQILQQKVSLTKTNRRSTSLYVLLDLLAPGTTKSSSSSTDESPSDDPSLDNGFVDDEDANGEDVDDVDDESLSDNSSLSTKS